MTLFKSAPYCYQDLTNLSGTGRNFENRVKTLGDAAEMVDFIGGAPNEPKFNLGISQTGPMDSRFQLEVYGTEKEM